MEKTVEQVFREHKGKISDKWKSYLTNWDRIFPEFRNRKVNLLEIGVQNGGSLEVWGKYFHNANRIIGCDNNPKCGELTFNDNRIFIVVGDSSKFECKENIVAIQPTFDIIIDDGSHQSQDVICTFALLFPLLDEKGIYIIEDTHTSYWKSFGGGLHHPLSSISFLKRIADIINFEFWGLDNSRSNLLKYFFDYYNISISETVLASIHSIEFLNSLCIIKKSNIGSNQLGDRVVTGIEGIVATESKAFSDYSIEQIRGELSDDSNNDVFMLDTKLRKLEKQISNYKQTIKEIRTNLSMQSNNMKSLIIDNTVQKQQLEDLQTRLSQAASKNQELINGISKAQDEVLFYRLSNSWKITRPLRKLIRKIRGGK